MASTTLEDVEDFLDQKRIAFVGVSRNPNDFSRTMFRDLREQGCTVISVNPQTPDVEGSHCFARAGREAACRRRLDHDAGCEE